MLCFVLRVDRRDLRETRRPFGSKPILWTRSTTQHFHDPPPDGNPGNSMTTDRGRLMAILLTRM